MLRGAVFVILDGVFFQDQAVSPREILDVIDDGALVAGAASMGALRAAECWPAGMRGIGSIYRLFRRGVLDSDDEVAVAFDPAASGGSSVALINVRYAVWRAQRDGQLEAGAARAIVEAASGTFYADRRWPSILRAAQQDPAQGPALARHDLKALDAVRALQRTTRWLRADPALLERPRRTLRGFVPSEERRERPYDARSCEFPPDALRREFARFMFASGRYLNHVAWLGAAAAARLLQDSRSRSRSEEDATSEARGVLRAPGQIREDPEAIVASCGLPPSPSLRAAARAMTRLDAQTTQLRRAFAVETPAGAELLWLGLHVSDHLDAELFRFHAQRTAAARAETAGLQPSALDRHAAELSIATAHGYGSWNELLESVEDQPNTRILLVDHCRQAALAKAAVRVDSERR
jgi:hypothetical protein